MNSEQYVDCFFIFPAPLSSITHIHRILCLPRVEEGVFRLSRRRGVMSERFKEELAKELGFYDVVQKEGWGGIRAKDAGNMVKRAVELAQQQLLDPRR
jgi:small acid-soluble spore protein F (minor alpha/beta-type SASP)